MDLSKRAKEIIKDIIYITLATSSKDGQPWNSPVYSAYDKDYNFYWGSWRENQHSKNIAENNRIFVAIYDSKAKEGTGEGVYILAKAYMLEDEEEVKRALGYLDGRVGKKKDSATRVKQFLGDKPRRIYKAVPEKFWVNGDGDINGEYIDVRFEVNPRKV